MINCDFLKFDYIKFLCENDLHQTALYFALYLRLPDEDYPIDLRNFSKKLSAENFQQIFENVEKFCSFFFINLFKKKKI